MTFSKRETRSSTSNKPVTSEDFSKCLDAVRGEIVAAMKELIESRDAKIKENKSTTEAASTTTK